MKDGKASVARVISFTVVSIHLNLYLIFVSTDIPIGPCSHSKEVQESTGAVLSIIKIPVYCYRG